MIEREKGGVKLFVGRLPREVTQRMLNECFEEFGEVLEVFVIDSKAMSNVGCAFIRMGTLEAAENAIQDLHEQRVLIPDQRELGPMQVAFAKGEAVRLGLEEKEEILPSFKEARMKVVEHNEKRQFFEAMQKQHQHQHEAIVKQQELQVQAAQATQLPKDDLVAIIKDGQRCGGHSFKQRWWSYCDRGWQGIYDYDPSHHPQQTLAQFVSVACFEHGHDSWFKRHFENLPELPPGTPLPPPPFPLPPFGPAPPGAPNGPPGMPLPPFPMGMPPPPGVPGMPPGFPGMPPHGMPSPGMPPLMPMPPCMPGVPPMPGPPPGPGGPCPMGAEMHSRGGSDAAAQPPKPSGDVDAISGGGSDSDDDDDDAGDIEDINADDI